MTDRLRELAREWLNQPRDYVMGYATDEDWKSLTDLLVRVEQEAKTGRQKMTEQVAALPNGCTLFREKNAAGGYTYYSDEVGSGVVVWDTALVDESTLLAAIGEELRRAVRSKHDG